MYFVFPTSVGDTQAHYMDIFVAHLKVQSADLQLHKHCDVHKIQWITLAKSQPYTSWVHTVEKFFMHKGALYIVDLAEFIIYT